MSRQDLRRRFPSAFGESTALGDGKARLLRMERQRPRRLARRRLAAYAETGQRNAARQVVIATFVTKQSLSVKVPR
jgi:hypothetical protein